MKQTRKERTTKEIIEAAKEIIRTHGHESLTVRSLAGATGYSYTNVYYYFKDLNTLFWVLRLEMIEDMIDSLLSVPIHKEKPIDEILESLFTYIAYYFHHPNIFKFFYFYSFVPPTEDDSNQELEARFSSLWQTSFSRLVEENMISPKDIEVVSKTILYSLQGMIMLSFSSNGLLTKEDIELELEKIVTHLLN